MINSILFDMDGVLINSEQFYSKRRKQFLREKGIEEPAHTDLTGSNEKAIWKALVPNNENLRKTLQIEYKSYEHLYPIPYSKLINPQVNRLFMILKGKNYELAIISSSPRTHIESMMKAAGIEKLVDYFISGEDCKEQKPNPEIYTTALHKLNISSDEAYVVEDSVLGIEAAKRAGIYVFALEPSDGTIIDQSKADSTLKSLMDILKFLP